MKKFDVQAINLQTTEKQAFSYIANPKHLPQWTSAFASVANGTAQLRTPDGEVEIGLVVRASEKHGTIDWVMKFPDGGVATAFSRVVKLDTRSCAFTFVLTPPPVPLERLEGALDAQSQILAEELLRLKTILER